MSLPLITALISASGLILGSVIGGLSSWIVTKNTSEKSLREQVRLQRENIKFQERNRIINIRVNANQIRLDLCNAIFQSIKGLQNNDNLSNLYVFSINKNYHSAVASLHEFYTIKELSYIYQLYSVLEKVNYDIYNNNISSEVVSEGYLDIIKKVYGEFYGEIIKRDIQYVNYYDLCSDKLMKEGYRNALLKLNRICKKDINYELLDM